MAFSGQQFPISAGEHEVTIVEVGAGLRGYRHRGADVTVPYGEDVLPAKGNGSVLVPWPNRLRHGTYPFAGATQQLALSEPELDNAIHGLARWVRWTPVVHEPARITLELDIPPQKGYPFEIKVDVSYAVDAELGLSVTTSAHNHGTGPAPFGAGFHPYLSTRGASLADTTLLVPAAQRLLLDANSIPTAEESVAGTAYDLRTARQLHDLRLDDGYTAVEFDGGRGRAEVRSAQGGAQLWFDDAFDYLQVFTLDNVGGEGPGVAIEPMTCAADAFNSSHGLIVLDPGATWSASWGITPL